MKTLNEYIEERLIINKNYKGFDNRIIDIIKELLDNPEDDDIKFDGSYEMFYFQIITDMINTTYDAYSMKAKQTMYDKIRKAYKFMPNKISTTNYKRALRKLYIDTESNYSDEINELYEYLIDNKDKYSIKNCELGNGDLFSMIMNETYILSFLLNEKTNEIFELFIIECQQNMIKYLNKFNILKYI